MTGRITVKQGGKGRELLEARLRTMLPDLYQDSAERVEPVSMGSAGLKFAADGTVAWDEIWGSFCHLAMAGGPPHRGTLLEPGSAAEIQANRGRHAQVRAELCRGITLVTGLGAAPARDEGWVRVECPDTTTAGWLVRAIVMENVSARAVGAVLELPAGPGYRLEKEIRNVITAVAKTCHYWFEHTGAGARREIAELFQRLDREAPLLQPDPTVSEARLQAVAESIRRRTGLQRSAQDYAGWLGLECVAVARAIWRMRALATRNVLARREGTVLFVPGERTGERLVEEIAAVVEMDSAG